MVPDAIDSNDYMSLVIDLGNLSIKSEKLVDRTNPQEEFYDIYQLNLSQMQMFLSKPSQV